MPQLLVIHRSPALRQVHIVTNIFLNYIVKGKSRETPSLKGQVNQIFLRKVPRYVNLHYSHMKQSCL